MKGRLPVLIVVALALAAGLALVGAGVWQVVVQETGTPAKARIISCTEGIGRRASDVCEGIWTAGGSLLDGGRVVTGTVDGAEERDVGKTLDVRLSGDRAYVKSWRVVISLIALGLVFTAVGVRLAWVMARRAPQARA